MIWLTSDWHLDHDAIIGYTNRPYRNAHEMNSALLANTLSVIRQTDVIYMLGDFAFNRQTFDAYASALRASCNVSFIKGNHDVKQAEFDGLAGEFKYNKHHFYLCHYPWATWRPNTVMLHGHCHGNPVPLPSDSRQQWRYDVGVDTDWSEWGGLPYHPVSIEMIERRIEGQ